MKLSTIGFSILMFTSTMAFGDIRIDSISKGNSNEYTLFLNGPDAKALNDVLKGDDHYGDNPLGIDFLTCPTTDRCTINIGADEINNTKDLRNSKYFKAEADSILTNKKSGISISSPSANYYFWVDTRKLHAKNDKELFRLLKKNKSTSISKSETSEGLKLTLKSPSLNLSCIHLKKPEKFVHSIIDLGHMGSLGTTSFLISYICQLNVKVHE